MVDENFVKYNKFGVVLYFFSTKKLLQSCSCRDTIVSTRRDKEKPDRHIEGGFAGARIKSIREAKRIPAYRISAACYQGGAEREVRPMGVIEREAVPV